MPDAAVILLLSFVMPGQQPDIQYHFPYETIEECIADVAAFTKHIRRDGMPKIITDKGAIAAFAGCRVKPPTEKDG
jgi:hypothetical protein